MAPNNIAFAWGFSRTGDNRGAEFKYLGDRAGR